MTPPAMSINPSIAFAIVLSVAVLLYVLVQLFRENRLFFWSLLASVCLLLGSVIGVYALSRLVPENLSERMKEIRIAVAVRQDKPKPEAPKPELPKPNPIEELPAPEPPKPEPPKPLDLPARPQGRQDGNPDAKVVPKGSNPDGKKAGAPGDPRKAPGAPGPKAPGDPAPQGPRVASASGRTLTGGESEEGIMPGGEASLEGGLGSGGGIGKEDILGGGIGGKGTGGGGGEGGDDAGSPDGEGKGAIPVGFRDGKRNGRLYFVRLKHGSGAWNAHSEGMRRLLAYMNDKNIVRAETDSWPMSTEEMKSKYMTKGAQPTFLYMYVDDSFSLSRGEVDVLREYINKGGFLFLDSRPDELIVEKVRREMSKVIPGTRLEVVRSGHPINRFIFRLSQPGVGENYIKQQNFGISRGGRLIVFYSPGNFSHMLASHPPVEDYIAAQYQMVVNIVYYAISKGNEEGVRKRAGANAKITTQVLEKLGLFTRPDVAKPTKPRQAPESVKIKRTPSPRATPGTEAEPEPDDIKILD